MFFKGFVDHKLGFQLEKPGGLVHAALVFAFAGIAAATGSFFPGRCLAAAIGGTCPFLRHTCFRMGKQRHPFLPHAIAINAVHAHTDRSGQQSGYPEPCERFCGAGRHVCCLCPIRNQSVRQKYRQRLKKSKFGRAFEMNLQKEPRKRCTNAWKAAARGILYFKFASIFALYRQIQCKNRPETNKTK